MDTDGRLRSDQVCSKTAPPPAPTLLCPIFIFLVEGDVPPHQGGNLEGLLVLARTHEARVELEVNLLVVILPLNRGGGHAAADVVHVFDGIHSLFI